MDVTQLGLIIAGGVTAFTVTVKAISHRGDRKLIRHIYDQDRNADVLGALLKLVKFNREHRPLPFTRPTAIIPEEPASPPQSRPGEEASS